MAAVARGRYTSNVRSASCPTCRRKTTWAGNPYRPFCSERCRVVDLAAWADGRYRIPGEPVSEETEPSEDEPPRGRS